MRRLSAAMMLIGGLAACGGPAEIDGCMFRSGDITVDLRRVSGVDFDANGPYTILYLAGIKVLVWLSFTDRLVLEPAWRKCIEAEAVRRLA